METDGAITFLKSMAESFKIKAMSTKEDTEYWANVLNVESCEKVIQHIKELRQRISEMTGEK